MSAIYHTEPPTQGKILLKTSYGDIDIELWAKEAPLACRNFIQLALEGYYDNSPIHRVIKDFMVQMGDPTGTGTGGETIWGGRPFKDEIHGRILFNHRGQLAMANDNKPHTNMSQFFVTLGPCEWLNRKHTIFGKVTGDTIFNLMRMGETEVRENDRPVEPITLLGIDVLWNPFDDIIPRVIKKEVVVAEKQETAQEAAKRKRKATRDLKLLSFGEEEEESAKISLPRKDTESSSSSSSSSSKDIGGNGKSRKSNGRSAYGDEDEERDVPAAAGGKRGETSSMDQSSRSLPTTTSSSSSMPIPSKHGHSSAAAAAAASEEEDDEGPLTGQGMSDLVRGTTSNKQEKMLKERSEEFQRLKENLLRSKQAVKVLTGGDAEMIRKEAAEHDLVTPLEQRRQKYIKRKTEHGSRSDETFAKLQQFTNTLRASKAKASSSSSSSSASSAVPATESETYHGQVLERDSDEEDKVGGLNDGWHIGGLKFKKHALDDKLRMGGDGRSLDDYTVIDNRNQ